jgi:hypothetical protein
VDAHTGKFLPCKSSDNETSLSWTKILLKTTLKQAMTQELFHNSGSVSRSKFLMFIPDPDLVFLPILDPGSRGQQGTGSGIPIPDLQHWDSMKGFQATGETFSTPKENIQHFKKMKFPHFYCGSFLLP